LIEQLQSLDPAILAEVVRQDQKDPGFAITDWTVSLLSDHGIINPEGLILFSGHGRSGQVIKPWSVVLKVLPIPDQEGDPSNLWYWKRELLAFESGLLARLPGPVAAPRYYGLLNFDQSIGMWMEHILETVSPRWTLNQYAIAARQLGQFNGAYLSGTSLPNNPWLSAGLFRTWFGGPLEEMEKAWENPIVRQAFSGRLHERCRKLWEERERFYQVLDWLPQVFSHFDFHRRNLLMRQRPDGRDEVVAVDWAMCGIGALGGDLYSLIGMSMFLGESHLLTVSADLDRIVFEAYLEGLELAGWKGNPDLVRLGYTAWIALWIGASAPGATSAWTSAQPWWTLEEANAFALKQFGKMGEELAADWAVVCEFGLDRAVEARGLMEKLPRE
jgi:hypothetical protein